MSRYSDGLVVQPKPESKGLYFTSVSDALKQSLGAKATETAPGGTDIISDIGANAAFVRAEKLGLSVDVAANLIEKARGKISAAVMECDSPIERRLLPALVLADYGAKFLTFPAQLHLPKADRKPPQGDIVVIPQFAFIRYRCDFLILADTGTERGMWAVECDGDEFHNNRPRHDRDVERDEYLAGFGIETFRFTGGQIYSDANGVAQTVADVIGHWREARP